MLAKHQAVVSLLVCCLLATGCTVQAANKNDHATLEDALKAADLSILLAAVQAAGVDVEPEQAWTILAPTNYAFTQRLNKTFGIAPGDLLKPANRPLLIQVLSYHVIPSAAVLKDQLKDCQAVPTALPGAMPLTVRVRHGKIDFEGATNDARVEKANIKAGASVVHVVDDVLLPSAVGKKQESPAFASLGAAVKAANLTILADAIEASGLTLQPGVKYTILAPSNYGFSSRLKQSLNMQPHELLKPENRGMLVQVLSYHIIPGAALLSEQLTDKEKAMTALQGAGPLTVSLKCNKVDFVGGANDARVQLADMRIGKSMVVHVVDDVLLPKV